MSSHTVVMRLICGAHLTLQNICSGAIPKGFSSPLSRSATAGMPRTQMYFTLKSSTIRHCSPSKKNLMLEDTHVPPVMSLVPGYKPVPF